LWREGNGRGVVSTSNTSAGKTGISQFRKMSAQDKDLSGFKDFPHREQSYAQLQTPVKSSETPKPARAIEENTRDCGMELSI